MTVHANDIVFIIRNALKESNTAPSQSGILVIPNDENTYPNRDGTLIFECVGRDFVRAFRISVQAIDTEDAPEAMQGYDDEPPSA
jgi:hypothetical protein